MSSIIIDRRSNGKRTDSNRNKFVKRVKKHVQEQITDILDKGKITDLGKNGKVKVPKKTINEPSFELDRETGKSERILPGNDVFDTGDRFNKPESGAGSGGSKGSPDGEGEDEFSFTLKQDEFLEYLFEGLELPDLQRKKAAVAVEKTIQRAGFAKNGSPSQLDLVKSMKTSLERRMALLAPKHKKLRELEEELEDNKNDLIVAAQLEEEIRILKRKIAATPFLDEVDLRYKAWDEKNKPVTKAVMYCLMDCSASMGDWEKDLSKRFFTLLYLFLTKNYKQIEVVFVRHHTSAKEVDEEEFFYSRESGGTRVSPGLELINNSIKLKYPPSEYNIYLAQLTDGDNWVEDNPASVDLLTNQILPKCRHAFYVEVNRRDRKSDLWDDYETVKNSVKNMSMAKLTDAVDIYPTFIKFFKKDAAQK